MAYMNGEHIYTTPIARVAEFASTGYMAVHVGFSCWSARYSTMPHGWSGINTLCPALDHYHVFTMQRFQYYTWLLRPHPWSSSNGKDSLFRETLFSWEWGILWQCQIRWLTWFQQAWQNSGWAFCSSLQEPQDTLIAQDRRREGHRQAGAGRFWWARTNRQRKSQQRGPLEYSSQS